MTGDLYIDGPMLARVRSNFGRIHDLLGRPASAMRAVDASGLGPPELVGKVHDFGREWHYGIDQLSELASSVVEALDSIDHAFRECDANLADALRKAGTK